LFLLIGLLAVTQPESQIQQTAVALSLTNYEIFQNWPYLKPDAAMADAVNPPPHFCSETALRNMQCAQTNLPLEKSNGGLGS
jgi:hypothetical protein